MRSLVCACSSAPYYHVPILNITYLASASVRVCNPRNRVDHSLRCLGFRKTESGNKEPHPLVSSLCVPTSLHIQILVDRISEQKTELGIYEVPWLTFVILVLSVTSCSLFLLSL